MLHNLVGVAASAHADRPARGGWRWAFVVALRFERERDAERRRIEFLKDAGRPASRTVFSGFHPKAKTALPLRPALHPGPEGPGIQQPNCARFVVTGRAVVCGQDLSAFAKNPALRRTAARAANHRVHAAGPPPLRQPVPVITAAPSVEGSAGRQSRARSIVNTYLPTPASGNLAGSRWDRCPRVGMRGASKLDNQLDSPP